MPKMKTSKSAAKRFRVTKTGKVKHKRANLRHLLTGKAPKRARRLRQPATLTAVEAAKVRQLLPYA